MFRMDVVLATSERLSPPAKGKAVQDEGRMYGIGPHAKTRQIAVINEGV